MAKNDPVYSKKWHHDKERGLPPRTMDAHQTLAHIERLNAGGMSYGSIASAAGLSRSTITKIVRQGQPKVTQRVATALLAVRGPIYDGADPEDETFVPRTGAVRRIQALLAIGWTHQLMSKRMDQGGNWTANFVHQKGQWVTRRNHLRVVALYDALWNIPGPSAATRRRAARKGYLPPLAWDDDSIDDPAAWGNVTVENDTFDEVMVERLMAAFPKTIWREARATREDRLEAARRLDTIGRRAVAHLSLREQADSTTAVASRNGIATALGLKQGRDFGLVTQKRERAS
jgi:lambda repressor-like predicted transcriptional regulator